MYIRAMQVVTRPLRRLVLIQLSLLILFGMTTQQAWSQAGNFQFTTGIYSGTELEGNAGNDLGFNNDSSGILVTVSRTNGTTGRMLVDYTTLAAPTAGKRATATLKSVGRNNDILFTGISPNGDLNGITVSLIISTNPPFYLFDATQRILLLVVDTNLTASIIVGAISSDPTLPFTAANAPANDGSGTFSQASFALFSGGSGPAVADQDYFPTSGTLVFDDFQMSASFIVRPSKNGIVDGPHLFQVQLTNAHPDVASGEVSTLTPIFDPTPATIRVEDVEDMVSTDAGTIQFTQSFYRRTEDVGTAHIQVRRSGGINSSASVDYKIITNSIVAGSMEAEGLDMTGPLSGTITFAPGATVADITVDIVDDNIIEFNEDFQIVLSNPSPAFSPLGIDDTPTITNLASGYVLGSATVATVTIDFDDAFNGEQPAGAVDRFYNPDFVSYTTPPYNPNPGANFTVNAVVVQPDGQTLLAGDFTTVNATPRKRIARMTAFGSLDTSFASGSGPNDFVEAIAIDSKGQIYIGGGFTSFNGVQRNSVARLNVDGSLDNSFNPAGGANGPVYAMALQSDGRLIVAGNFTTINGVSRNRIARLNVDGSLDTTFSTGSGVDGIIWSVAMNNQQILIGGDFNTVNGQSRSKIAQLTATGSLDPSFSPGVGANDSVYSVTVGQSGILVGGAFTTIGAQNRQGIARLNQNGSLDTTFNPGTGANNSIYTVAQQTDGNILIGGIFTSFNGTRRINIARLLPSGIVDTTFMDTAYNQYAGLPNTLSTSPENFVNSIALQADGNVMIGGSFSRVGGGFARNDMRNRNNFARLIGGATPGPGNIGFTRANYYGDENGGSLYVFVQRSGGFLGNVSGDFNTADLPPGPGAATANVDYAPVATQVLWVNNQSGSKTISIPVFPDALVEVDETAQLFFANPSGTMKLNGEPLAIGSALGTDLSLMTILDLNFSSGVFSFSAPTYTVNENGVSATISVTRTNGSTGSVSVDYATTDGTATSGADYTAKSGSLSFASGQTSKTFTIPISNDNIAETDETVFITLKNARGGAALDFSSVDPLFNPGLGANDKITAMAFQTNFVDGQLLVAGEFTTFAGVSRNYLARLNSDGTLDTTFLATDVGANGVIKAIAVQPDGQILVGGNFTTMNGVARNRIARLNFDGSLDATFDPGTGADAVVNAIALQSTGEILIGGDFIFYSATQAPHLVRLTSVGALDPTFNTGTGPDGTVNAIKLQTIDGEERIVVGGAFNTFDFNFSSGIVRLHSTGANDTSFSLVFGANGPVYSLALQANNSLIIGGDFTSVDFTEFNQVARITPTNGLDLTFNAGTPANGKVLSVLSINEGIYSGKIIIGGDFTVFGNANRNYSARLNSNGSLDSAFNPVANGAVNALLSQNDNKVTMGGAFTAINGLARLGVARISTPISTLTIIDDDYLPGRASFTSGAYNVEEGNTTTITVQRTGGSLGVLSVNYSVTNGTATNSDYIAASGKLTWNSGDSSPKTFTFTAVEDTLVEGNETVQLQLSNARVNGLVATNALGTQTNAIITIVDNDAYGSFAFNSEVYSVNENAGVAIITVLRTGGSAGTATVDFSTSPITADLTNYVSTNGTLVFLPGEISKTFTVAINDNLDQNPFGEVSVDLTLSSPTPIGEASLGAPFDSTLRIIDNESVNAPSGSLDTSFNSSAGANDTVYTLALQDDKKILLGGEFTTVNDVARNHVARLNEDGTLDATFPSSSAVVNGSVRALTLQSDSRILIGGLFTSVGSANLNRIARFNPDGTVDGSFNPGAGADNSVLAIAESFMGADRKILIAGSFAAVNGVSRSGIARLNDNGSLDATFNPGAGVNGLVYGVAVQSNGKIIIVGDFVAVNSLPRFNIARLNSDGSVDTTFDSALAANHAIRTLSIQNDGRILIGGAFTQLTDSTQSSVANRFARLNANGSLDSTFTPGLGANDAVYAIALQVDGKIVLGGEFTRANDVTRSRITRLNSNGTVDPSINFGTGANNFISTLAIQEDGKIVLGGGFTEFNSQAHSRIARIYGDAISGAGTVEFLSADFQVNENATNALITVRREGGTAGDITVAFATSDASGQAGIDYVATNGILTFKAGETVQTFNVPVIDTVGIGNKQVNLTLTNATAGATLGNQSSALLTIIDNDIRIDLGADTYTVNENSASGGLLIPVQRFGLTNGTVTVNFATILGTATTNDFTPTNGTLTFAPGETNLTFSVRITDDTLIEGNETFSIILSAVSTNAAIGRSNAVVTIVDNDFSPGSLGFTGNFTVLENTNNAVITVVRTGGSGGVVSINYATTNGTAKAGEDYQAVSGTLAFADGETNKSILVPIIDDLKVEGNEAFTISLSNPTGGALLSGASTATVTILDDEIGAGTLDPTFTVGAGANNLVHTVAVQPDGKLVIGGAFTTFDNTNRNYVARLTSNGPLDTTFSSGSGANGEVASLSLGVDGKINLGGFFSSINAVTLNRIGRLQTNGSVDTSFNQPNGINASVNVVAVQPDGKVIVGGTFNQPTAAITRVRANGSVDPAFAIGSGANGAVNAALILTNGIIVIGGDFDNVNGNFRSKVARIHPDGLIDLSFAPTNVVTSGRVYCLLVQPDGKTIIGGDFVTGNSSRIIRLNLDGTLDSSFDLGNGITNTVFAMAMQVDGKIIIGGDFTSVNGTTRNKFARLNVNGSLDTTFDPGIGANGTVYSISILPDGKIILGGDFTTVNGSPRAGIARLYGDGSGGIRFLSENISGGQIFLTISTFAGRSYILQAAPTVSGAWASLVTNLAPQNTLTFSNSISGFNKRFYRVQQVGP